jgi:hypothetical protein
VRKNDNNVSDLVVGDGDVIHAAIESAVSNGWRSLCQVGRRIHHLAHAAASDLLKPEGTCFQKKLEFQNPATAPVCGIARHWTNPHAGRHL